MSWKPSETEIIDYLYGSLTKEENEKFEAYLKENSDFAVEVNALKLTHNILPDLTDEEVLPPVPIPGTTNMNANIRHDRKWLYPISIAASISVLLLIGYLTQFSMDIGDKGFKLAFNDYPDIAAETLTKDEILSLINHEVSNVSNEFQSNINSLQTSFTTQLQQNQRLTEAEIKRVASRKLQTKIDEGQILAFIAQLQDENKKAMQTFYQASADKQQIYMRNVLLDFNDYLDEQRKKDLQYIQTNMLEIRNTSELKQEETDKILANIITTVNNQNTAGR